LQHQARHLRQNKQKKMTHTEDGALEGVLIAASVVFGVCAIAAKLLALWL